MLFATAGAHCAFARVQVVRTFAARLVGLLRRKTFGEHEGILLVSGGPVHTLGLRFAIDAVFLDAELKVLGVTAQVRPWWFAFAPRRTHYVLTLRAGHAHAAGLREGQSIVLRSERHAGC